MSNTDFTGASLQDALNMLLDLQDRLTAAQIDAACCGTSTDYRKKQKCEAALDDGLTAFRRAFDVEGRGKIPYVVEYDRTYTGGDYSGVGTRVVVRASCDEAVREEFRTATGIDPVHIVHFRVAEDEDLEGS